MCTVVCDSKKFFKGKEASGFFSSLGIKTSLSKDVFKFL